MIRQWNRRELLAQLAGASVGLVLPRGNAAANPGVGMAREDYEVRLTPVSDYTIRLSVLPIRRGTAGSIASDGSLVRTTWGPPAATIRGAFQAQTIECGKMKVRIAPDPLTFT
ncbi:MAG: hypothetical protein WBW58_20580, partial [Candidatus Acidiferrum sp.]